MLNLSGDTAGNVKFRTNRDTCLSNLTVVLCITCIHSGTAGTYFSMKFFSQVEQQVEVFFRTYTETAGYDNRRTFQVVLGFFTWRSITFTT